MTQTVFYLIAYICLDLLFIAIPSELFVITPALLSLQVMLIFYKLYRYNNCAAYSFTSMFIFISLFFYTISAAFNYVVNSSLVYSAWFFDKYSASSETIALALLIVLSSLHGCSLVHFKTQQVKLKLSEGKLSYEVLAFISVAFYLILLLYGFKYDSIAIFRDVATVICIVAFYFSSKNKFLILMLLVQIIDMFEGHRWRFVGYFLLVFFLYSYDKNNFKLFSLKKIFVAILLINILELLDLYRHGLSSFDDLTVSFEKIVNFVIKQTPVSNVFYYVIDQSVIDSDFATHSIASIFYPFIKLFNLYEFCQYYAYSGTYDLCRLGDVVSLQLDPLLYDSGFGVGGSVYAELFPIFYSARIPITLYFIFFYFFFKILRQLMYCKSHLLHIVVISILPYIFFMPRDSISNFFAIAIKTTIIYLVLLMFNFCVSLAIASCKGKISNTTFSGLKDIET